MSTAAGKTTRRSSGTSAASSAHSDSPAAAPSALASDAAALSVAAGPFHGGRTSFDCGSGRPLRAASGAAASGAAAAGRRSFHVARLAFGAPGRRSFQRVGPKDGAAAAAALRLDEQRRRLRCA